MRLEIKREDNLAIAMRGPVDRSPTPLASTGRINSDITDTKVFSLEGEVRQERREATA
jgi:DNA-binding TFAR19-related protein (PDSD5 family)